MHVHVAHPDGEAKFWIKPVVALADHTGLNAKTLREVQEIVEERNSEITQAWKKHFGK